MSENEIEVRIRIGEVEFYAKGKATDVSKERKNFENNILTKKQVHKKS